MRNAILSVLIVVCMTMSINSVSAQIQTQTVWQIGKFDNYNGDFGGYDFPSMVDYTIPANWDTKTSWKDFPSGQQAWKTDNTHPYNSNGINIHFEIIPGEYVLTVGQIKTAQSETVTVLNRWRKGRKLCNINNNE